MQLIYYLCIIEIMTVDSKTPSGENVLPAELAWLLLIHQIPAEPAYLRVKIGRRLERIGAVAIKNSVYALPAGDAFREDFEWIVREIESGGGEGSVCEARFVEGLSGEKVRALFIEARQHDYAQLAGEARGLLEATQDGPLGEAEQAQARRALVRLKRRLEEVAALDFFSAPGRGEAEAALVALEGRLRAGGRAKDGTGTSGGKAGGGPSKAAYRGRTWVTREGLHFDRIASAWLILRFVDDEARFRFVQPQGYVHQRGEVRFDMFDAEFTHEGDACTFEVLMRRMGLEDPGLRTLAEIVHDLDLKDGKFERPETAGIGALISALTLRHTADDDRLAHGAALFDDLYHWFSSTSREMD